MPCHRLAFPGALHRAASVAHGIALLTRRSFLQLNLARTVAAEDKVESLLVKRYTLQRHTVGCGRQKCVTWAYKDMRAEAVQPESGVKRQSFKPAMVRACRSWQEFDRQSFG